MFGIVGSQLEIVFVTTGTGLTFTVNTVAADAVTQFLDLERRENGLCRAEREKLTKIDLFTRKLHFGS